MSPFKVRILCACLCASVVVGDAAGLTIAPETSLSQPLERRVHEGQFVEQYVSQVMAPFRQADPDGDGLATADIARRRQERLAQARAQNIGQALRYDLNGDMVVTPEEVAAVSPPSRDGRRSNELERFDVDGDGRVTLQEIAEASTRISQVADVHSRDEVAGLMALPEARDGRLTAAELEMAARAVFTRADSDSDGRISPDENQRFRSALTPEAPRPVTYDVYCPMPRANANDLIVMFGAYEGQEPAARAGEMATLRSGRHATGTATIHIEPGTRPIYLILPSYEPILWTVTGAVGRVRQAVVSSYDQGDEATPRRVAGIPPQRVRVFGSEGCVRYFHALGSPEAEAAKAAVALRLGRQPDVMTGAYKATDISLPAGAPAVVQRAAKPARGTLGVIDAPQYASRVKIDGLTFTATDETVNVYLNQPIASGRRYWEVKLLCGPIMTGVVADLTTPRHWGGYSKQNAGVYTWNPSAWPTPAGDGSERWPAEAQGRGVVGGLSLDVHRRTLRPFHMPGTGTIFGFALDADQKTLRMFMDGLEGPTVKLAFAGPYYPHSGVQIGFELPGGQPCPEGPASGQFLFKRGATRYPPPQGYTLLGG